MRRPTCVATTSGSVEGFHRGGVIRWRAIPYGMAPRGRLRFRAPEPVQPWRGLRQCREFTFSAPQDPRFRVINGRTSMGEDCLWLNVVAPATTSQDPLPVMVFIHGGGYVLGCTSTPLYDGATLVRRGCIYVSVNYRLGPLGCLDLSSLGTAKHPIESNLFLRDLVLALQWVRDNIAAFGGDADNVTVFGESAGAHAVTTLLAMPTATGLFRRAIAQSAPAGMVRSAESAARIAAAFVEHAGISPSCAAEDLVAAKPAQLVKAMLPVMQAFMKRVPGDFGIGATVDGDLLPTDPIAAMQSGEAAKVPLIVGHNADEARLFAVMRGHLPVSHRSIERLLSRLAPQDRARVLDAFPGYPRSKTCLQFGGDVMFGSYTWRVASAHSQHAPTYRYRYDYAPRQLAWSGLGATHAMELLAVFGSYRSGWGNLLTVAGDRFAARRVSDQVQSRWLAFSRYGVPGEDWACYNTDDRPVMVFDRTSRIENDPQPARRLALENVTLY